MPGTLVEVLLGAVDLLIYRSNKTQVQQAPVRLHMAVHINLTKVEAMESKQKGRSAATDILYLFRLATDCVNRFLCLELLLSAIDRSLAAHVTERYA